MSSDGDAGDAREHAPSRASTGELFVDVLKATYLPLLFGIACLAGLVAMWWFGFPEREFALAFSTICIVGPFAVTYIFLFIWIVRRRQSVPILLLDEDHSRVGLKMLSPSEFGQTVVDGDQLPTRDSKAGKVYLAEDHRIEQRERVNPDTGEMEQIAVRVLEGTWEAGLPSWKLAERWSALKEHRENLKPLAQSGVRARAGADDRALKNTDKLGHALLLGAERDSFLVEDDDPFDWDDDVELRDIEIERNQRDDREEREQQPRPGSRDVQDSLGGRPDTGGDDRAE